MVLPFCFQSGLPCPFKSSLLTGNFSKRTPPPSEGWTAKCRPLCQHRSWQWRAERSVCRSNRFWLSSVTQTWVIWFAAKQAVQVLVLKVRWSQASVKEMAFPVIFFRAAIEWMFKRVWRGQGGVNKTQRWAADRFPACASWSLRCVSAVCLCLLMCMTHWGCLALFTDWTLKTCYALLH